MSIFTEPAKRIIYAVLGLLLAIGLGVVFHTPTHHLRAEKLLTEVSVEAPLLMCENGDIGFPVTTLEDFTIVSFTPPMLNAMQKCDCNRCRRALTFISNKIREAENK